MHTVPAFLKENPVIYDGFPPFSEWGKYENLNNGIILFLPAFECELIFP